MSAYTRGKTSRRIARRWAQTLQERKLRAAALESERRLLGWPTPLSAWETFAEIVSKPDAFFKLFGDAVSTNGNPHEPHPELASLCGQVIGKDIFLSGFAARTGKMHGGLLRSPSTKPDISRSFWFLEGHRPRIRAGKRVILALKPESFVILDNKEALHYFPGVWAGVIYAMPEVLVS